MSMVEKITEEWDSKPPNPREIPEGIFVIQADAAFKNGITGIAVRIKTKEKEYKPQTYSARNEGPIHAELTAIKKGLMRLKRIRKKILRVVVYNDNRYAYYFLTNRWNAKKRYIKQVIEDIQNLVNELGVKVEFIWTKGKHLKKEDKLALKKRKNEEQRKEKQIQERVMKVEEAIVRGRDVTIYKKSGEFFALSKKSESSQGYKVSLNPPSCECPWWKNKWGNKPEYIQRARALPCKHMCALAEYLEVNIFEIFEKQIGRVD